MGGFTTSESRPTTLLTLCGGHPDHYCANGPPGLYFQVMAPGLSGLKKPFGEEAKLNQLQLAEIKPQIVYYTPPLYFPLYSRRHTLRPNVSVAGKSGREPVHI